MSEPAPGTAHAGLDLVHHEQGPEAFGERAGAAQEVTLEGNHAGLALDGLDENGGHVVVESGLEGLDRGIDEEDVPSEWLEGLTDRGLVRDRQGAERAAMEAALERDDRAARLVQAGHLDCGLVRLGARVAEEDAG